MGRLLDWTGFRGQTLNKVHDIMIILGPPGPDEEKKKFEEWSKNSGKPKDELWLEFVHQVLGEWAKRESPESASKLDELLSNVLKTPVRVNDPFMTYTLHGGIHNPGVILYTNKITESTGRPIEIDWSAPQLRGLIGDIFGYVLKTEWVRTFVSYDS
jgi:hypothetical protein